MEFDLQWESGFDPENAQETFEDMLDEADDRLTEELDTAGLNITKGAQQRSPVDTGNLRASWRHELDASGLLSTTLTLIVGNQASYFRFVEFGTRHMAAQPMLRPAWDDEIRRLMRRIRMLVAEVADEVGR